MKLIEEAINIRRPVAAGYLRISRRQRGSRHLGRHQSSRGVLVVAFFMLDSWLTP